MGQESPGRARRFTLVVQHLRAGKSLSSSLQQAGLLPPYFTAALASAEQTGGGALSQVLRRLAPSITAPSRNLYIELYPLVLVSVFLMSAAFFMGFVRSDLWIISRLTNHSAGHWWAHFPACLIAATVLTCVVGAMLIFLLICYVRPGSFASSNGFVSRAYNLRAAIERHLPFYGARLQHLTLARCSELLSLQLSVGMPLHQAVRVLATPELGGTFCRTFARLADDIESGAPLDKTLATKTLPISFTSMFRAAGRSGDIPAQLLTVSDYHAYHAQKLQTRIGRVIAVATLGYFGVLFGAVSIGVLSLLLEMTGALTQAVMR
jgi:type II secretory pathway component PulF